MVFTDTRTIRRYDFEEFGKRIGLPDKVVKQEMEFFMSEKPMVKELLNRSFLSEELKREYYLAFDFRRKILNF